MPTSTSLNMLALRLPHSLGKLSKRHKVNKNVFLEINIHTNDS